MNDLSIFKSKLPDMRKWIDETLDQYSADARPVSSLTKFTNLSKVLPMDILDKAKVVVVDGKVPIPPLSSKMGLTSLAELENNEKIAGITYKDTFFINSDHLSEKLHFHELVHVVQWDKLGVDNFLLAYGDGIMKLGYRHSPLEEMAYSMQKEFDAGQLSGFVDQRIQKETDGIWNDVLRQISAGTA